MIIVATTSFPAVDRPNAERWNVARSCQKNIIYLSCDLIVISLVKTKNFLYNYWIGQDNHSIWNVTDDYTKRKRYFRGTAKKNKNSKFKDIVQIGGREVNPISKNWKEINLWQKLKR